MSNNCSLIRKYKIYKSFGIFNKDENSKEIFDFFDEKLSNLKITIYSSHIDWNIYETTNGECILEYHLKTKSLYVKYKNFCDKFKISDIKEFIKYKVEKLYNIEVETINISIQCEVEIWRKNRL